jgi:hypothetical protein
MLYPGDIIIFTLNNSTKYPSNSSYIGIVNKNYFNNNNFPYIKCIEISIIKKLNSKNEKKELYNSTTYIFFLDIDISYYEVKDSIYKYYPNNRRLLKNISNFNIMTTTI